MLVFLTPLIVAYELGSAFYLTRPGVALDIHAKGLLDDLLHLFGDVGLFAPGLALVTVLITWHLLNRDRWFVRPAVLLGMFAESLAWTLPLLVLSALHAQAAGHAVSAVEASAGAGLSGGFGGGVSGGVSALLAVFNAPPAGGAGNVPVDSLMSLPWQARLTLAIGAGLYEEMLFRLVVIALFHVILADVARIKSSTASVISVAAAAVFFALYHQPSLPEEWAKFAFLVAAGLCLGGVYVIRGLGIVVAAHALYDVLVLVLLS